MLQPFAPYARFLGSLVASHEGDAGGQPLRLERLTEALVAVLADSPYAPALPGEVSLWPLAVVSHDIGKLAVPGDLLRKPGPLSVEEFGLVRTHTLAGHDWLSHLATGTTGGDPDAARFWRLAAQIAGGHHERPDGRGYPLGLKGDAVPLVLRIARTADVYDALTTRRAYRDALPTADALRMMRHEIGGFDEFLLAALETVTGPVELPVRRVGGWE